MDIQACSYTGDGTTPRSITGLGLAPAMVWVTSLGGETIIKTPEMETVVSAPAAGPTVAYIDDAGTYSPTVTYKFVVTFEGLGETTISPVASFVPPAWGRLLITPPNGPSTISRRNIYREHPNGWIKIAIIAGNTGGSHIAVSPTDNIGGFAPTVNSTGVWSSGFASTGIPNNVQGIRSLDADGFTIGSHSYVNANGTTYYYLAFKVDTAVFTTGVYNGNGTDNRDITGAGFEPAYVHVGGRGASTERRWFTTLGGDSSFPVGSKTQQLPDFIQGVGADGFQVGTGRNNDDGRFWWCCFKATALQVVQSSYVGNGLDDRGINAVGFPDFLLIRSAFIEPGEDYGYRARYRHVLFPGEPSAQDGSSISGVNWIQSFITSGFIVGSDASVNQDGQTLHYLLLKSATGLTCPVGVTPGPELSNVLTDYDTDRYNWPFPVLTGFGVQTPYTRYKSIRAAVDVFNNVKLI